MKLRSLDAPHSTVCEAAFTRRPPALSEAEKDHFSSASRLLPTALRSVSVRIPTVSPLLM